MITLVIIGKGKGIYLIFHSITVSILTYFVMYIFSVTMN